MKAFVAFLGALILSGNMVLAGDLSAPQVSEKTTVTVMAPTPAQPSVAPATAVPAPVQPAVAQAQDAPSSWKDVGWQALGIVLSILGTAAGVLVVALLKKWLGKMGIEMTQAQEDLLTTLVKKGVNHAQYQAQQAALASPGAAAMDESSKVATAVAHVLELAKDSGLPELAREKVEKLVQAQYGRDRSMGTA